jgi:hypothetical protein
MWRRIDLVVPAKAGTHNHRCLNLKIRVAAALSKLKQWGVWVPAFAGTTTVFAETAEFHPAISSPALAYTTPPSIAIALPTT